MIAWKKFFFFYSWLTDVVVLIETSGVLDLSLAMWTSMLWSSVVAPTVALGNRTIPFNFCLKFSLSRAYTKGLIVELNNIRMLQIAITTLLNRKTLKVCKVERILVVPQQIPNMILTTTAIKVTRLRTLITPWGLKSVLKMEIF